MPCREARLPEAWGFTIAARRVQWHSARDGHDPRGGKMQHFKWESMQKEQLNPKFWRKLVTGEKAMLAQIFLGKGFVVPEHHHESEQISYIVQGALKFNLEGKEIVVRAGEVLLIPSHVPHSAVALEDTIDFDIFSPIRHDWLDGTDNYLRK